MNRRTVSILLAACMLLSLFLSGCQCTNLPMFSQEKNGQNLSGAVNLPPFEELYVGMDYDALQEIAGEPDETDFNDAEDNVLGYDCRIWEYQWVQPDRKSMSVDYWFNDEIEQISFAVMDISDAYYGDDGLTESDMEKLALLSQNVRAYYTQLLGEPAVETEGDYTEYTWSWEEDAYLYLRDGVEYSMYCLELWWNCYG